MSPKGTPSYSTRKFKNVFLKKKHPMRKILSREIGAAFDINLER